MAVQPSQGHEPGDTPPEELDRLIGAAAEAARELVGSRPSDRAGWLEHLATRLDAAADDLVALAAQETHFGVDRLQGELKRTTFQLRLSAAGAPMDLGCYPIHSLAASRTTSPRRSLIAAWRPRAPLRDHSIRGPM
jgi:acyl-CoA reductase-like NAD-dependent aldehyde dehydrogenase